MSISFRESIRWLPADASEPTRTIVLCAKNTNVFLDVRFNIASKGSLDWAFAGHRFSKDNKTTFKHVIDSRAEDASNISDEGTNVPLPDGRTLESGSMVNPATGQMTAYEEIWRDEEAEDWLFACNTSESAWYARVGRWHLGLGRTESDFWAWQARLGEDDKWELLDSTPNAQEFVSYLPRSVANVDPTLRVLDSSQPVVQ
ncbi:hypothetical protein CYLTODRAFT_485106 [Cylindrobasidium torrendii FP15055 ss-10]|uniref:Protein HRI1 n=1 Tax=Cylindrobasidium torrendii FP15055 ss-10 TaxID=1314674 RepID=A0A0D7BUP9_9AGAR|nr:hypothetical protein CYLTODRAFT_485106 [Cylindrobasidium torrendii FP15055 ss-10]